VGFSLENLASNLFLPPNLLFRLGHLGLRRFACSRCSWVLQVLMHRVVLGFLLMIKEKSLAVSAYFALVMISQTRLQGVR
jgi:hypothetical protein